MISGIADKLLKIGMMLPAPANRVSFAILKRLYFAFHRVVPSIVPIRFGVFTINAPLDHPAVYWRYRPATVNRNYILLTQKVLENRSGIIIDVGANIGDGIALLRSQGIEAPIYAIEGTEDWFEFLSKNTSGMRAVTLENAYLGATAQKGGLTVDKSHGTGILIEGKSDVEIKTLDSLLDERPNTEVAVLKTDTDGFDVKVLYGSKRLLSTKRPIVFAEVMERLLNENGDSSAELLKFLMDQGYSKMLIWDHDGIWLGSRPISDGIGDLLVSHPGWPGEPYLDMAFLSDNDHPIGDAVEREYAFGAVKYKIA